MFFAAGTICSKILGLMNSTNALHPLQVAHARFFFALIFISVFILIQSKPISSDNLRIHFIRSSCGWAGVSILFTAILFIPVSDATAITFLNPIFAMLLAVFILNEKVGIYRGFAALITFSGAILLIRPTSNLGFNPVAVFCLLGAIIMGLEIICIKILSGRENFPQILFINNLMATIIGSIPVIFVFQLPDLVQVFFLVSVGLCFLLGQFFFLNAMRGSETTFIAPFFYSTLIFVMILDFLIYKNFPDLVSFIGSAIIVIGGTFIAYRERLKS